MTAANPRIEELKVMLRRALKDAGIPRWSYRIKVIPENSLHLTRIEVVVIGFEGDQEPSRVRANYVVSNHPTGAESNHIVGRIAEMLTHHLDILAEENDG